MKKFFLVILTCSFHVKAARTFDSFLSKIDSSSKAEQVKQHLTETLKNTNDLLRTEGLEEEEDLRNVLTPAGYQKQIKAMEH